MAMKMRTLHALTHFSSSEQKTEPTQTLPLTYTGACTEMDGLSWR